MKKLSDYKLQRRLDKSTIYNSQEGVWWSSELSRWMCTDPEVIEQILKSDEFGVHDFKVDQLAKRLSLDLGAKVQVA